VRKCFTRRRKRRIGRWCITCTTSSKSLYMGFTGTTRSVAIPVIIRTHYLKSCVSLQKLPLLKPWQMAGGELPMCLLPFFVDSLNPLLIETVYIQPFTSIKICWYQDSGGTTYPPHYCPDRYTFIRTLTLLGCVPIPLYLLKSICLSGHPCCWDASRYLFSIPAAKNSPE